MENRSKRRAAGASVAAIVLSVTALLLTPVWRVRYPPLLDYPNHLARAYVTAHLHHPALHFGDYWRAEWRPYPYLTMDLLLIGLHRFQPMETAGRIVISLSLLALPAAAVFFLRRAAPGQSWLAVASLLVTTDVFFLYGFLNFQLGLAALLAALGAWLAWYGRPSWPRWLLTFTAVMLAYFTHLIAFGLAALIIALYVLFAPKSEPMSSPGVPRNSGRRGISTAAQEETPADAHATDESNAEMPRPSWSDGLGMTTRGARALLLSSLLFLPGAVCYAFTRAGGAMHFALEWRPFREKFTALPNFLAGFNRPLDLATVAALVLLGLLAWWRNRELRWNHPWPAIVLVLFALYWVTPLSIGGLGWPEDLRLLPVVVLLLPACARIGCGWRAQIVAIALLALFCAREFTLTRAFRAEEPEIASHARGIQLIPNGARVLPIIEPRDDTPQQRFYAHFWAWGIVERGWRAPYLLTTPGTVPLRLRGEPYAPDGFWELDYSAEQIEWDTVREEYHYVWLFGAPQFEAPLSAIGELVFDEGDLQVWRVKK